MLKLHNPEIEVDLNVFPNNVIQAVTVTLEATHPAFDGQAFPRQLKPEDPDPCIGVFPALWVPQQESLEMGRDPRFEPTLNTYGIVVQAMNKDSDKDVALARHSTIARMVRNALYRSDPLRVLLSSLVASDGTTEERFRKMTLTSQRFLSNEIRGTFVFLSVLELSIETEIA